MKTLQTLAQISLLDAPCWLSALSLQLCFRERSEWCARGVVNQAAAVNRRTGWAVGRSR